MQPNRTSRWQGPFGTLLTLALWLGATSAAHAAPSFKFGQLEVRPRLTAPGCDPQSYSKEITLRAGQSDDFTFRKTCGSWRARLRYKVSVHNSDNTLRAHVDQQLNLEERVCPWSTPGECEWVQRNYDREQRNYTPAINRSTGEQLNLSTTHNKRTASARVDVSFAAERIESTPDPRTIELRARNVQMKIRDRMRGNKDCTKNLSNETIRIDRYTTSKTFIESTHECDGQTKVNVKITAIRTDRTWRLHKNPNVILKVETRVDTRKGRYRRYQKGEWETQEIYRRFPQHGGRVESDWVKGDKRKSWNDGSSGKVLFDFWLVED